MKAAGLRFGGRLGDDTIVEHVEKANVAYTGFTRNSTTNSAVQRRDGTDM